MAKKQGRIMFLSPSNFKFLGTSYEKWVKTNGSSQTKSWLPYEWFDCTVKLDYESLPSYRCWFYKLKDEFVLSPEEYEECLRVFRAGNKTFADWLKSD